MLLSWLVVTNHCAMGLMLRPVNSAVMHAHCHSTGGDDSKQVPGDGVRECCRAIKANLPDQIAVPLDASQGESVVHALILSIAAPALEPELGFFRDHGPPRAVSFAEIVLQRSLLSHAPPSFV
jgi:hypothetical protein